LHNYSKILEVAECVCSLLKTYPPASNDSRCGICSLTIKEGDNMYQKLIDFVRAVGLWGGERSATHAFLLSPKPHVLTKDQGVQLNVISRALQGVVRGLAEIFTIATESCSELGRKMQAQIPSYFAGVMHLNPNAIPFLNKIDLVEDMDGKFWIVEMDSGNPRALGYSTLFQAMTKEVLNTPNSFSGVLDPTIDVMNEKTGRLVCVLSGKERWYLPWFEILVNGLRERGLNAELVPEGKFVVNGKSLVLHMPLAMDKPAVRQGLLEGYKSGGVDFLMPPKPFLGSKAMLAIICNMEQDPELEVILRSKISEGDLETLRSHIPPTVFNTETTGLDGETVLKSLVSSGMKGVIFSSDPAYARTLQYTRDGTVIQKLVEGKQHNFDHFEPNGELVSDERYVRLIAHCGPEGVADVFATARTTKAVHGAKDSVLTSCIIE